MSRMTDEEVMEAIRGTGILNRARKELSSSCAQMEQAQLQRKPPTSVEMRRMEFEAVKRIAKILNAPIL